MQWQVIYSNPAARVKPPKVPKKQAACYDEDQMVTLLGILDQLPLKFLKYRVMVDLALATGLCRGELMGLEWKDIDIDNCTLEVRQASQYLPGKGCFVKDPKNESSKRLISVPVNSIALLKKWKAQQSKKRLKVGDLWHKQNEKCEEENWVFTTWDGRQMHPDTPTKWFNKFLAEKKLPHIPWHGLRHTSATLLIADGSDIREVSGRARPRQHIHHRQYLRPLLEES